MPISDTDNVIDRDTRNKLKPKKPELFQVVLINDDYTPFEFVILVLNRYFNKSPDEAISITMHTHKHGKGVCGVYTLEICEAKVNDAIKLAKENEFPLNLEVQRLT